MIRSTQRLKISLWSRLNGRKCLGLCMMFDVHSLRNAKNPACLLPEDRMTMILHNHNQLVHPTSNHVTKMKTSFGQKNYPSFFAKHKKQTFFKVHQTYPSDRPIEQKIKKQKKVELTKMTRRNAFIGLVLCAI